MADLLDEPAGLVIGEAELRGDTGPTGPKGDEVLRLLADRVVDHSSRRTSCWIRARPRHQNNQMDNGAGDARRYRPDDDGSPPRRRDPIRVHADLGRVPDNGERE